MALCVWLRKEAAARQVAAAQKEAVVRQAWKEAVARQVAVRKEVAVMENLLFTLPQLIFPQCGKKYGELERKYQD